MHSLRTTHISPSEWRWVFIIGGLLTALTLAPYAWALAANANATDWQFMGILANPRDGASYLVKIEQGMRGAWLLQFMHTPEPHTGAAIQVFYPLLGHLARLVGMSSLVIFHLARVLTTLFMFSALYQFGATIWSRVRPRRLFFVLVSVGSGLGWVALMLGVAAKNVPDVTVPEAYPLYAAYANPHFPLAIGCLALLAAQFVTVFRIDFKQDPALTNGGLSVFVLTLIAAFVFPQALMPLGAALTAYLVVAMIKRRAIPVYELRWVSMFMLPAGLMAAYYYAVLTYNPIMGIVWNGQVDATSASPLLMLLAYGLLLVAAVPGIWRAVRRFEEDGDRLMILWLALNFVLVFLPFNQQRRFMAGLIIPVTFFAVRSLEDYWLPRIPDRARLVAMALFVALLLPSNVLALGVPLFGLLDTDAGLAQRLLVQHGYWEAMSWLNEHGSASDVVLSAPNVGLWIPPYGFNRVVYGHPWETLDPDRKQARVEGWYSGEDCTMPTLADDGYTVQYVLVGPQERVYAENGGQDTCYRDLESVSSQVIEFTDVTLYELADQD